MSVTETDFQQFYKTYSRQTHECLDLVSGTEVQAVVDALWKAYTSGARVWVAGNGGSAATAIHFACCLSQGTMVDGKAPLRAGSLVENISFLTAVGNDISYDQIFTRQLQNCLSRDDVFVAITCSGNSPNVVSAVEYANAHGAHTIGFLGFTGGKLKTLCRTSVYLNNDNYGQVETVHLSVAHLISQFLKERIMKG